MAVDKIRIRFCKRGDLRLVSHHDLMRCFERMLRRAALPFHSSSGFHPKPRLVFALSLPLGVVGRDEVVELELNQEVPPEEISTRLSRQAPAGLEILSVHRIDPKAGAQVRRATYRLALPDNLPADLPERITRLLGATECWVERSRPHARRFNLRLYLDQLRLVPAALEMDLWITPTGSARAEEVLQVLCLDHLLASGAVLERTRLELQDESIVASDPWPEVSEEALTTGHGSLATDH
jgi:radical SAM-linked protein